MRRVPIVLLVVGLLTVAAPASAQTLNEETTTTRPSGTFHTVVVENENGSVTVQTAKKASVTRTEYWNLVRQEHTETVKDGVLTVRSDCANYTLSTPLTQCVTNLVVSVPKTTTVKARTYNGVLRVTGFTGKSVTAAVSNGDVILSKLRTPVVRGSSSNGRVGATLLSRPRSVTVSTSNGDVGVIVPKGTYDLRTRSSLGDVSVQGLRNDDDASRVISASTSTGDVILRGA